MDLKYAAALLFFVTFIFLQSRVGVDIFDDTRNDKSELLSSILKSYKTPCPENLPCLKESKCRFGHRRNLEGCMTCECLPEIEAELYQNSIVLTKKLKRHHLSRYNKRKSRTRVRRAAGKGIPLWNNLPSGDNYIIPYAIEDNIGLRGRKAIAAAIADFEAFSCLRFVVKTNQTYFINLYKGDYCSSPVGRLYQRQWVALAPRCWTKGTALHEVMHSLGFWHEQSRPDRDNYIRVNFGNIRKDMIYNFNKMNSDEIDSLNSSYDIGSVMHYNSTLWSVNGSYTMTDLYGQPLKTQRKKMSQSDIEQLNRLYRCAAGTGKGAGNITEQLCYDENKDCILSALDGNCSTDPDYMLKNCCASCKTVGTETVNNCLDTSAQCPIWASKGKCTTDPEYMRIRCCKSCHEAEAGNLDNCTDIDVRCPDWASIGECIRNPDWMPENCCASCKKVGNETLNNCRDIMFRCPRWASQGECKNNPNYMLKHCCLSCRQHRVANSSFSLSDNYF